MADCGLMIGLELGDARAIAVRIDERGAVQARAAVDAAEGDLVAAATKAIDAAATSAGGAGAIGVTAAIPDAPAVASVMAALVAHPGARPVAPSATPSGLAAAVAEAWIGAARGIQDAVYFSC